MFQTNQDFIRAVANLRPITAFSPLDLITMDIKPPSSDAADQSIKGSFYWTPDAKQLWFQQYCTEKKLTAKIVTQFLGSEPLNAVADSCVEGNTAQLLQEHWRASILVNGEVVSEADATGIVKLNSWEDRKYSSNQTRKYAIGAALSQYGFGAISTFPMTEDEINQELSATGNPTPATSGAPGPITGQPTHTVTPPVEPAANRAPQMMQDNFFGNNPVAPPTPPVSPANQPPVAETAASPAPQDPLIAAKNLMWPGKGKFAGKTLGDILSAPGAQKNLEWTVNDWNPRSDEGKAFQAAAKLVLDSIATGK